MRHAKESGLSWWGRWFLNPKGSEPSNGRPSFELNKSKTGKMLTKFAERKVTLSFKS